MSSILKSGTTEAHTNLQYGTKTTPMPRCAHTTTGRCEREDHFEYYAGCCKDLKSKPESKAVLHLGRSRLLTQVYVFWVGFTVVMRSGQLANQ